MKPQIYDATTELGDKIRLRVFPRNRNVQEPTENQEVPQEVPQEIQQEIPQENSEKHPDNMFKVIIYSRSKSQDAEFDGAGYQAVGVAKSSRTW